MGLFTVPRSSWTWAYTSRAADISWDKEFSAQELQLASSALVQEAEQTSQQRPAGEADELARTAGALLENLKHEQNPKFQKSQFMGLMRQLRDGEVTVEGNDMVESDGRTSSAQVDVKGKRRAISTGYNPAPARMLYSQQQQANGQRQEEKPTAEQEDANDAYFRQENADFIQYWNDTQKPQAQPTAETMAWDQLQTDWDSFEATASGIKPVTHYQFQASNPYLVGDSSTRHHLLHTQGRQSVLEVCGFFSMVIITAEIDFWFIFLYTFGFDSSPIRLSSARACWNLKLLYSETQPTQGHGTNSE